MASSSTLVFVAALALLAARVGKWAGAGVRAWGAVGAVTAVVASLPVAGVPIAGYARAALGDPSITSLVALGAGLVAPGRPETMRRLARMVVAAAIVLYPMALGSGPYDTYRLGYAPFALLGVLLALSLYSVRRGDVLIAVAVLAAVAGYGSSLLESANLWDYLIDPWLAGACLAWSILGVRSKTP